MQAKKDAMGAYLMNNVPEGTYELRFEKSGYMTAKLVGISVTSGQTTTLGDLILNLSTGATGSLTIENGNAYSASRTVAVSITASADATLMQISEDSNFIGGTWIPVSSTTTWTFASDGEKRLYIKFADANGLESAPVSDGIIVDTVPPTNESIAINMGTPTTNSTSVTLTLSATDATTSVSQMMISNSSDFSGTAWETFNGTRSWTLPSGDGTKTIYAKFKDIVGNETTTAVSASILLDTQSPTNAGGSIQEGAFTNNRLIHLSLTASNATFMKISEDPHFTGVSSVPYAAISTFTLSSGDGNKTVYVRYLDDAGNIVDFTLNPIILDTTLPDLTHHVFRQKIAEITVGRSPEGIAASPDGRRVFVSNMVSDSVSVINAKTLTVETEVILGPPEWRPFGIVVTPDSSRVFVADWDFDLISVLSNPMDSLPALITRFAEPSGPFAAALSPDGGRLFVTHTKPRSEGSVGVIDTKTLSMIGQVRVGEFPDGIAVHPHGRKVYVSNGDETTVTIFDSRTLAILKTIETGDEPRQIAFSPDGREAFVANRGGNTVAVIDTTSDQVIAQIPIGPDGEHPRGIAVSPDGQEVWVANAHLGQSFGSLSIIDRASQSVVANFQLPIGPYGIAFSPDGSTAYVVSDMWMDPFDKLGIVTVFR